MPRGRLDFDQEQLTLGSEFWDFYEFGHPIPDSYPSHMEPAREEGLQESFRQSCRGMACSAIVQIESSINRNNAVIAGANAFCPSDTCPMMQ